MKRHYVSSLDTMDTSVTCSHASRHRKASSRTQPLIETSQKETNEPNFVVVFEKLLGDYEELHRMSISPQTLAMELSRLNLRCQDHGLFGRFAVDIIKDSELNLESKGKEFDFLYNFSYFVSRERGKKHLSVGRACELWNALLIKRFRLLPKWIDYLKVSNIAVVTRDVWREVYYFSQTVQEDLSNYDLNGAWPVMLDEFVLYLTKTPNTTIHNLSNNPTLILTPSSGNKRSINTLLEMENRYQSETTHRAKHMKVLMEQEKD